jgi:two-component system cell cycle response regulator
MIRLTRKVFTDLALWMVGLGFLMGVAFPFFCTLMGIPASQVLTPWFFAACIAAGLVVGEANILLVRSVVGNRLRLLADRMKFVQSNLFSVAQSGNLENCSPESCSIEVDSADEIGESAAAFNSLVTALSQSLHSDAAVRSFSEMLTSQVELELLSPRALEQLLEHTGANAGALLIEVDREMQVVASHGIRLPDGLAESDHIRRALRTEARQRVVIPEGVAVEGVLVDFRPHEVLVEPISYKHVPLGVIVLASAGEFLPEIGSRLDLLRNSLALAINNAIAHDRLQRLAALDPLTGIYNRRFGLARLQEEFGRAIREGGPLGLLMFDIDHFKSVNDTYGHLIGDRVLSWVAKLSRTVLREGDVLVRYGGEEFLAVLPGASRQNAALTAERLRRMVEEAVVRDGSQEIRVTVSIGVTAFPNPQVQSEQDLVRQSDEALYSAKESGRNRVVTA